MSKKISFVPQLSFDSKLQRYISNCVGDEIFNLSKSCYYGKFVRYYLDIQKLIGITDDDIKEFRRRNISSKYLSFKVFNNKHTLLFIIAVLYFARTNRSALSRLFFVFLALKFQASLMHKYFKFCNEDLFILALDQVSHRHLYRVKGGISPSVTYIAEAEYNRNERIIKSLDLTDDLLVLTVNSLRNRLSQTIRSFAGVYYKLAKERGLTQKGLDEEIPISKSLVAIDKISQQICTFGNIDKTALSRSILKSGIRKEIGIIIVSEMSVASYREQIKFLLVLLNHLVPLKEICKESKRLSLIRKVDGNVKIGKYLVRNEFTKVLKSLPSSYRYNSIYKGQLVIFLSNYLTLYLRNRMC